MTNTQFLVNKHDKQRMPYEDRGNEYDKQRKREERKRELKDIAYDLFAECENYKKLQLSSYQRIRVLYLIDTFGKNFKRLHGTAKKETVILAFIFYIKKNDFSTLRLKEYAITSEYNLTNDVFEIIICRLLEEYMKNAPVIPQESTNYNHEILSRNGGCY